MNPMTSLLRSHNHGWACPSISALAVAWLACCGGCSSDSTPSPTLDAAVVDDASDADEEPETTNDDASAGLDAGRYADARSSEPLDVASSCPSRVDIVEGCVLSSDGALMVTPLVGTMTVSAIEDTPAGACRITRFDSAYPIPPSGPDRATRLTLDGADGTLRSVVIRAPGLPPTLFRVGETIDLSLQAWEDYAAFYSTYNQTFVLARAGQPVFVTSTLNLYSRLLSPRSIPDLTAAGIELDDDGAVCRDPISMACIPEDHRLFVRYGGESATLLAGETVQLGPVSLTAEGLRVRTGGNCDGKGSTQIAGFWSTPGT